MWALTKTQRDSLTRWFDGELEGDAFESERERVEALLDEDPAARLWISILKELQVSARGAFREIRRRADLPAAEEVSEKAADATPLSELSLDELAPLLEAYYDDAVTEPERLAVEELRTRREDVREFLAGLEAIGESVRAADAATQSATEGLDLWEGVSAKLDDIERQQLVMRYVDGELSDDERERVEQWLADDTDTEQLAEGIRDLGGAVRCAHEEILDTDLSDIWSGVERGIRDEWDEGDSPEVVSLESKRETREESSARATTPSGFQDGRVIELFSEYGQAFAGAAAAVVLMAVGGLLYQSFLVPNATGPQKQVVIVDSVQEKSGSVRVRSVKQTGTQGDTEESKVIWLSEDSPGSSSSPRQKTDPGRAIGTEPDAGGLGGSASQRGRADRDFPDGGTPIEEGSEHREPNQKGVAPAEEPAEQVDKPGDGPI